MEILLESTVTAGFGPMKLKATGKNTSPCNNPKSTTRKKILKKTKNTKDFDVISREKARNVENPPLKTAGPMPSMVLLTR